MIAAPRETLGPAGRGAAEGSGVSTSGRYARLASRPWILLPVGVAATALSFARSWHVSLWTDEAVTVSIATRTPGQIWDVLGRVDAVHGVYYFFMAAWTRIFGTSEFWLRLPSAIFIGLAVVGLFLLVRRIANPTLALTSALVAMILPRLTWAGIEARPFALSAAAAVWLTYLFVRTLDHPRPSRWAMYAVAAGLGVCTNIYLVLLALAHLVSAALLARVRSREFLGAATAAAAGLALSLPLILLVRSQQGQLGGSGERDPVVLLGKAIVSQVFLGETPSPESAAPWFDAAWRVAAVAAAAIGCTLMLLAMTRRTWAGTAERRKVLIVAIPWLVLPTVLVIAYAVLVAPLYQPRYMTFTAPAAAVLIGAGIHSLKRAWLRSAVVSALAICIVIVFSSQRIDYAKDGSDWDAVARRVASLSQPGDSVYFTPRYEEEGLFSHVTARRVEVAYPAAFVGLNDLTLSATAQETGTLDGRSVKLEDVDLSETSRLWVIYGRHYPDAIIESDQRLLADSGFVVVSSWGGPRSEVVLYDSETSE